MALASAWISSVISCTASRPPRVNSLMPFHSAGLWLAVMAAP